MQPLVSTIRTWGSMVKFPHSLFALPFALSGVVLAAARAGLHARTLLWVVVAMLAARNAAMGFNRLVDARFDARNPRTAAREIPSGRLSSKAVAAFTALLALAFVLASFALNRTCGLLAPLALAAIFGYSYTKRFTWLSHAALGVALAMAPVGGWLAVSPEPSPVPWILGAAVFFWVAGFDIIYACQDVDFDRAAGLYSLPARFGVARALRVARVLHAAAVLALAAVGVAAGLHPLHWIGVAAIAALLVREHRLVRPDDLSQLGVAFFHTNAVISAVYFVTVLAALCAPALRAG